MRTGVPWVSVWCAPQLATDVLAAYRPRMELTSGYSIKDYPHLLSGVGQELFGRHLVAVEVVGCLLLAALVGAVAIVEQGKRQ